MILTRWRYCKKSEKLSDQLAMTLAVISDSNEDVQRCCKLVHNVSQYTNQFKNVIIERRKRIPFILFYSVLFSFDESVYALITAMALKDKDPAFYKKGTDFFKQHTSQLGQMIGIKNIDYSGLEDL